MPEIESMDLDLGSGKNLDRFGAPYLSNGPFTSKIMQNDAKRRKDGGFTLGYPIVLRRQVADQPPSAAVRRFFTSTKL